MTVEIDESTGLPKLPNGDFWRVSPPSPWYFFGGSTEPTLEWVRPVPAGDWGDWRDTAGTERKAGDNLELRTISRVQAVTVVNGTWFGSRTREEQRPVEVEQYRTRTAATEKRLGFGELPEPFTNDDVRELATDLVERRRKQDAQGALYGDYPPKRLGAVE